MVETTIKRLDLTSGNGWRIKNIDTGCYVDVIFTDELGSVMKDNRNFSFNRFESEQINELLKIANYLNKNYRIELTPQNVGVSLMPLKNEQAKNLLVAI